MDKTTAFGGINNFGTVFKLTPSGGGWTESVIHSFSKGSDGSYVWGGLVFDANGSLYGTVQNGGTGGGGIVYKLTPSAGGWTLTVLHSFRFAHCGDPDGAIPLGGLIFDLLGNLYGTTSAIGPGDGGIVFELTPVGDSWTYAVLHSFVGTCGFEPGPRNELVMGATGSIYGTTNGLQISNNYGTVFELTPSGNGWTYTDLHDFTCGTDGCYPEGGVAVDASGNIYGAASLGGGTGTGCGGSGCGVIFEITP